MKRIVTVWYFGCQTILLSLVQFLLSGALCSPVNSSQYIDLSYDELEAMSAACDVDTCKHYRSDDQLETYNCNCGSFCVQLDSCCVNSPFRATKRQPSNSNVKCVTVYGTKNLDVFMVDSCKPGWVDDGLVENMCSSNGEDSDDPFLTIPVTSLKTGITYKNYFCSVCNDDLDAKKLALWNIEISGKHISITSPNLPLLKYNANLTSWMATGDELNESDTAVNLSMDIPDNLLTLVRKCRSGLISNCSVNWTDKSVSEKCSAYMARVTFYKNDVTLRYRNPHCAMCNFENLQDLVCTELSFSRTNPSLQDVLFVGLFVLEDRKKKCDKSMVYDSLSDKCRILKCPRNHTFMEGKCLANNDL